MIGSDGNVGVGSGSGAGAGGGGTGCGCGCGCGNGCGNGIIGVSIVGWKWTCVCCQFGICTGTAGGWK